MTRIQFVDLSLVTSASARSVKPAIHVISCLSCSGDVLLASRLIPLLLLSLAVVPMMMMRRERRRREKDGSTGNVEDHGLRHQPKGGLVWEAGNIYIEACRTTNRHVSICVNPANSPQHLPILHTHRPSRKSSPPCPPPTPNTKPSSPSSNKIISTRTSSNHH